MGTDRKRYQISVNASIYQFQGAAYVYDKIKKKIGAAEVTQKKAGATGVRNREKPITAVEEVKRGLPVLRLVLKPDGNSLNFRKTRRIDVYIDPSSYENAIANLPGTKVGGIFGVGDFYIDNAYRPLRRCYR